MKKIVSETIDGSIKSIIQLKTLDNSLEFSQMFDALQDTPKDFQTKLIGALNSLSQTMNVPAEDAFNQVLCASKDDNQDVKKKMYNWWRAFFEVLGKVSDGKVPKVRVSEYNQKIDDLMAEILKAGDAESTEDEVVMESTKPRFKKGDFVVVRNGDDARVLGCYRDRVDKTIWYQVWVMDGNRTTEFPDKDVYASREEYEAKYLYEEDYEEADKADEDEMLNDFEFAVQHIGEIANKVKAIVNFVNPYCEKTFNEVDNTMKNIVDERGDSEWVSMDDITSMSIGESDDDTLGEDGRKVVIANAKKAAKKDGYDQYILFDKSDDSWSFHRKYGQTKADFAKFGQEVVGIVRAEDLKFVPFASGSDDGSEAEELGSELRPALDNLLGGNVEDLIISDMEGDDEDEIEIELESETEPLDEYEFLDKMLEDAEDINDVFDVYDGNVIEDGTVALNVTVHKEDVEDGEVEAEFKDMPLKYGWEYESFMYSNDVPGEEGTETIVVYFRPQKKRINEMSEIQDVEDFKDSLMSLTDDMFETYDVSTLDDGSVELNVIVNKDKVSYGEVEKLFAPIAKKSGWKFTSFKYVDKTDTVVANEDDKCAINVLFKPESENVDESDLENELAKGDDGWREIGQPIGEAKVTVDANDVWSGKFKVGDKVKWIEPDKGYPPDGWTIEDVTPGKHPSGDDLYIISRGRSSVMNIRGSELRPEVMMNEASVVVDANDVWDVLDLLDDPDANKNLTDLINSHVRTEDEIMDAIDSRFGEESPTKVELNDAMRDFWWIVDYLGLDVDKFKKDGQFVDPEKPVALEGTDFKDLTEKLDANELADSIDGWEDRSKKLIVCDAYASGSEIVNVNVLTITDKREEVIKMVEEYLLGNVENWQVDDASEPRADENGQFYTELLLKPKYDDVSESEEEQKPDEIKDGEKKYKQDGETKTLVTGADKKEMPDSVADPCNSKQKVTEMTIEQEVYHARDLIPLLWGPAKKNFSDLMDSEPFHGEGGDKEVMAALEQLDIHNLTELNDFLSFEFETLLETLGCDVEAWTNNLEIMRSSDWKE